MRCFDGRRGRPARSSLAGARILELPAARQRAVPERARPHARPSSGSRTSGGSRRPCSRPPAPTASRSTARPGDRVRHRGARVRQPDRPRPARSRGSRSTCPPTPSARATTSTTSAASSGWSVPARSSAPSRRAVRAARRGRARRSSRPVQKLDQLRRGLPHPPSPDTCCSRTARASTASVCGARRARRRRGRVHDRHVRLPGVDDRPVVRGPADHLHLPAHRQLRGELAGDGVRARVGARGDHARGAQQRGRAERRARAGSTG